jgi:hypothetical protein
MNLDEFILHPSLTYDIPPQALPKLKLLEDLIQKLTSFEETNLVANPFKNHLQKSNLFEYLKYHLYTQVFILIIGEASGHKGCKLTGIPFTSGYILANHRSYRLIHKYYQFEPIKHIKENSAKIVYDFFFQNPLAFNQILLWNAFPFHPHKENNLNSNRTPTKKEIIQGSEFLIALFEIFDFKYYHAIGHKAQIALNLLKEEKKIPVFEFQTFRHPSYGGKTQFIKQITENYQKILQIKGDVK